MTDSKVSDLTTRAPQATDLLMLAVEDVANYKAAVSTLANVFYPEWYGAVGDGTTDDSVAIQSAIDAAAAAGGGTVKLTKRYRVTVQAAGPVGGYACDYCLRVTADNTNIEGPGALVMTERPASAHVIILLFGLGGNVAAGPWTQYVGVDGVTFDGTALSTADRDAIDGLESGIFTFATTRYFYATNCTIRGGWGFQGAIGGFASPRWGHISGNRINDSYRHGIGFDGGRYVTVAQNIIYWLYSGGAGVRFQSNLDAGDEGVCYHNAAIGNIIRSCGGGVNLRGCSDSVVQNNLVFDATAAAGTFDIRTYSHALGKAEASRNTIVGNSIYRSAYSASAYVFRIEGENANAFDGTPLAAQDNLIQANIIPDISKFGLGVYVWGEQSRNNVIRDNSWDTIGDFDADDATPSVTGFDVWKTANVNATTVTMLDDGYVGQRVTIIIDDALTTIDFTGTNLKGNGGADWSPASGDFMVCTFDGTDWYCEVHDTT